MGRVEDGGWAGVGGIGPSSNVGLEVEGRKGDGCWAPLRSVAEKLGGENGEGASPGTGLPHSSQHSPQAPPPNKNTQVLHSVVLTNNPPPLTIFTCKRLTCFLVCLHSC